VALNTGHDFVVGVEQGLLPNFLHFSQGGSDTRRPTPAPSIILSPAAATARRTTPSRPGGGLSPTSDALIGHSPGGRPRRRGMTSARAVVVELMWENVKTSDFTKEERISNKRKFRGPSYVVAVVFVSQHLINCVAKPVTDVLLLRNRIKLTLTVALTLTDRQRGLWVGPFFFRLCESGANVCSLGSRKTTPGCTASMTTGHWRLVIVVIKNSF